MTRPPLSLRPKAGAKPAPRQAPTDRPPSNRPPTGRRSPAAQPADPTPATPSATSRLNKRMSELGLASRREADEWIEQGWVRVNGQVARMGMQVSNADAIEVSPQAQGQKDAQVTILLNKPIGLVSGQAEDGHLPAISLIQPQNRWSEDKSRYFFHPRQLRSLVPAGRLDIDSVGLLVLTQDGRIARHLIGEDSRIEKEYLVRVTMASPLDAAGRAEALQEIREGDVVRSNVQAVFPPELLERLRHGLSLDDQPLKPAKVSWQNPEQLRIVLREGKKRQIRRMCELVGLKVVGLKRVRIGSVVLGQLPTGQWRYLGPHERF
jgi:23S rRNA pseudouridine2604 synthase